MKTYSENQSDRTVLSFRGPGGEAATVLVIRKDGKVWLVFNGAVKTTAAMSDPEAARLVDANHCIPESAMSTSPEPLCSI